MPLFELRDNIEEVYMLDTPDGKHFCPRFLRNYRNFDANLSKKNNSSARRIVKVDMVNFEDSTKSTRKLVVPIVHAIINGSTVFCVYLLLTPKAIASSGSMKLEQYLKLPEMEIEGI
jgi:hypothetical protein